MSEILKKAKIAKKVCNGIGQITFQTICKYVLLIRDVRAKIFQFLLQPDNELLVSEMQKKKKKNGGHRLRFRDKTCGIP